MTATYGADRCKFVGDITQYGLITREQLVDIHVVRHWLAETAGSEQAPNLVTFSGRWCSVYGGRIEPADRDSLIS